MKFFVFKAKSLMRPKTMKKRAEAIAEMAKTGYIILDSIYEYPPHVVDFEEPNDGGQAALTLERVRKAAKVIKAFCDSRNGDERTDCIECPIKDICMNEPHFWEV